MALESPNQKRIWLAAGLLAGVVLFRCNSGKAWLCHGQPERMSNGAILLPGGRPVALGLGTVKGDPVVGQSDLLGWRSMVITPDMVGCRVAVICAIECKRTEGGRTSKDQAHFIGQIQRAGGIAGVANTPQEAEAIISGYRPPRLDLADSG